MYIIFFLISFGASVIGAICGIGGGVIIKPVLDAYGVLGVNVISFLSGCTVLSMTCYSVGKTMITKESAIDMKTSTPLAIGAAIGGIFGKNMFQKLLNIFPNANDVGAAQAIILTLLTIFTLVYMLYKDKIYTKKIENKMVCIVIGLILGMLSSFLGIGGGPINLVILFFFFSMSAKVAAQNSLYIILFSQITSLLGMIVTGTVPSFEPILLIGMIICGVGGGMIGRKVNKKIKDVFVSKLLIIVMILIIGINIYNSIKFLGA